MAHTLDQGNEQQNAPKQPHQGDQCGQVGYTPRISNVHGGKRHQGKDKRADKDTQRMAQDRIVDKPLHQAGEKELPATWTLTSTIEKTMPVNAIMPEAIDERIAVSLLMLTVSQLPGINWRSIRGSSRPSRIAATTYMNGSTQ